jgi:hypothetical protein
MNKGALSGKDEQKRAKRASRLLRLFFQPMGAIVSDVGQDASLGLLTGMRS